MDYLILIACECGNDEYFPLDNLPGGSEHCPFCSECGRRLTVARADDCAGASVDSDNRLGAAFDVGQSPCPQERR